MNARTVRSQAGFTLIEAMVALALIALLGVVMFEGVRFGQLTYAKVVRQGGVAWSLFSSQQLLRRVLESAYPQESLGSGAYGLQGQSDALTVTAAAVQAAGGGLLRYRMFVRRESDGSNAFVISWQPQRAGDAGEMSTAQEILVDRIAALEWSYGSTDAAGTFTWHDSWQQTQSLPSLIRLRVRFAPEDARRWPDLIIAPRITDDANCAFDVTAQRCVGAA